MEITTSEESLPLEIELPANAAEGLRVSWFTAEDSRERPLTLSRLRLPWAPSKGESAAPATEIQHRPVAQGGQDRLHRLGLDSLE